MKSVYFDDLYIELNNSEVSLFEHVPYEDGHFLMTLGDMETTYKNTEELIFNALNSSKFKALNLTVLGVPHRLTKKEYK